VTTKLLLSVTWILASGSLVTRPAVAANDTALRLFNVNAANTGYVRVPNHAAFSLQQFTFEAWVQRVGEGYGFTTDPSGAAILAKPIEGTSGSNIASWHLHWTNDGRILFNLTHTPTSSGVYVSSSAVATPLARHHIAVTFDGATVRLFIDGAFNTSAAWSLGTVYYGADDVLIGADNFALGYLRRFDGFIDDVRVWDRARTEQEIAATMNCRLTGSESGLVAYWTFDGSDLTDLTGHGHNGAVDGVPSSVTYASLAPLSPCVVGVEDGPGAALSAPRISLFPQPARDRVTVSFELPRSGRATIDVLDVAGRRIAVLAEREFTAGSYQVVRDVATLGSGSLGAGVWFVRLRSGGQTVVRPFVALH
jgi:hypothetical protein